MEEYMQWVAATPSATIVSYRCKMFFTLVTGRGKTVLYQFLLNHQLWMVARRQDPNIKTLSIVTFSRMTLSRMILIIMTISILSVIMLRIIMLSVIMLSVIRLSFTMLSAIMLSFIMLECHDADYGYAYCHYD